VTGLSVDSVSADLSNFVPGRRLDDNAHVLLRLDGGARGLLWASQIAVGENNALRLRLYGEKGGLAWSQESPDELRFSPLHAAMRILRRGDPLLAPAAARITRIPAGHPEGYLEAFATVYGEAACAIAAARGGTVDSDGVVATIGDGLEGMRFVDAVVRSSNLDGEWVGLMKHNDDADPLHPTLLR
jgi:predicted dehydrogenase